MITHVHVIHPPAEVKARTDDQDQTYMSVRTDHLDDITLSTNTGHLAPLLRTWADQVDLAEQGTLTAVTVPIDLLIFLAAPPSGQHPADVTVRKAISRLRTVGIPDTTIAVIERTVLAPAEVTR
jgi:hypothetical protein